MRVRVWPGARRAPGFLMVSARRAPVSVLGVLGVGCVTAPAADGRGGRMFRCMGVSRAWLGRVGGLAGDVAP